MLYPAEELQNLQFHELNLPLSRYLFKFYNKRNEIRKLKAHEKDFLFRNMYILRKEDGIRAYNLYEIEEASNFIFNKLILIYNENLNFEAPIIGPFGELTTDEITRDKEFIDQHYQLWINELSSRKGIYFSLLFDETNKKMKFLDKSLVQGEITTEQHALKKKYLFLLMYFIYYKVKYFFDEKVSNSIIFNINGFLFVINIYTYIHVLSRHYIPSINFIDITKSINDELPIINTEKLPISLKDIISQYYDNKGIPTEDDEYLIFTYNRTPYIIWIKYKSINELNHQRGFEVRTFYRCEEERDLIKMEPLSEYRIDDRLSYYF